MAATPLIEIFLLCYNRHSAIEAISSILSQTSTCFKLVVSNNSTDPIISEKIKESFPDVEVRNRGGLESREHFLLCMSEASTNYFCLFHDDDEMTSNFIESVLEAISIFPQAQAFATNARVIVSGSLETHLSFNWSEEYKILKTKADLLCQYFCRGNDGIAPYPSYVYRTQSFNNHFIRDLKDRDYGKYADVLVVMSQVESGLIVWINKILMSYHLHETNDGRTESLGDRLKLLSALKRELPSEKELINQYRILMYSNAARIRGGKYSLLERQLRRKRRFVRLYGIFARLFNKG